MSEAGRSKRALCGLASPMAPASPMPGTPGRAGGSKTPLKSPLGKISVNDDEGEKARAGLAKAANDYRRRCVPAGGPGASPGASPGPCGCGAHPAGDAPGPWSLGTPWGSRTHLNCPLASRQPGGRRGPARCRRPARPSRAGPGRQGPRQGGDAEQRAGAGAVLQLVRQLNARLASPPACWAGHPSAAPDTCVTHLLSFPVAWRSIKLASENKITAKNTWSLALIDHLSDLVKTEKDEDNNTNFQKASCTLDAGVKIYASRVDSVHTETFKVLGGLSRSAQAQPQEEEGDGEEGEEGGEGGGGEDGEGGAKEGGKKGRRGGAPTLEAPEAHTSTQL